MKLLVLVLLVIGVTLVLNGYMKQNMVCGPPKIVYKYVPRTFEQEQMNPVKPTDVFSTMFSQSSLLT